MQFDHQTSSNTIKNLTEERFEALEGINLIENFDEETKNPTQDYTPEESLHCTEEAKEDAVSNKKSLTFSRKYLKFFRKLEPHELRQGNKSRAFPQFQNKSVDQYECKRCKTKFNSSKRTGIYFRRHLLNVSCSNSISLICCS